MSPQEIYRIVDENRLLRKQVELLESRLEGLQGQIDWLQRQIHGRTSERFIPVNPAQLTLDLDVGATDAQTAEEETITYTRRRPDSVRTPHGREEIPAHLPRTTTTIEPPGDPKNREKVGEKVTEQLEYTPPKFHVTRIVRPVYAVTIDDVRTLLCAEMPPLCLDKGKAGPTLIAHTIVAKVEDHIPLYRQRAQIKRDAGMDVAESSIGNWFSAGTFWLQSLASRLKEILPSAGYLQMDETPLHVMVEPTCGKSTLGYMWLRHAPPLGIVTFDFDLSRSREVMKRLIEPGFRGVIQTDGYTVYDPLGETPGIIHAGCHGHGRRGFEKALTNDKKRATFALHIYRQLFAIEEQAAEADLDAQERLALRREKSAPLMAQFHEWLNSEAKSAKPKSAIGKAILYVLGRWTELTRFLEDGRIELSNNLIENRVRPFALGRRNWLFAGSEDGAHRLAAAYTVLGTCKLRNVNSFRYLCAVLSELPRRKANDIDDLLPINWKDPALS